MKVSIGRIVIVKGVSSNLTDEQPAVVNRVWHTHDTAEAPVMVNVTVFPDCGAPISKGSIMVFDSRELAIADYEKRKADFLANGGSPTAEIYPAAFWPERA